jgi:hypothetical protein
MARVSCQGWRAVAGEGLAAAAGSAGGGFGPRIFRRLVLTDGVLCVRVGVRACAWACVRGRALAWACVGVGVRARACVCARAQVPVDAICSSLLCHLWPSLAPPARRPAAAAAGSDSDDDGHCPSVRAPPARKNR